MLQLLSGYSCCSLKSFMFSHFVCFSSPRVTQNYEVTQFDVDNYFLDIKIIYSALI